MANLSQTPLEFDSTWKYLLEGIILVFEREHITTKYYMELYQAVYTYCTSVCAVNTSMINGESSRKKKKSVPNLPELPPARITSNYNQCELQQFIGYELYSTLRHFVGEMAHETTVACRELSGESLLECYTKEWEDFKFSVKVLDGIFAYLNRHWVKREIDEGDRRMYTVFDTGLQVFRMVVFQGLEGKLRSALSEEIRKERCGDSINGRLISATIENLIAMGLDKIDLKGDPLAPPLHIYRESFEKDFLETTRAFYSNEVREFMQVEQPDCKEYMKKVWQRIQQEENRVTLLLNSSTLEKLQNVCNDVMITEQLEFIQSHFGPLLVEKADDDLGRMYMLCSRVPSGLDALRRALQAFITKEGLAALEQRAAEAFQDPKVYVSTILEVHERYQQLVDRSFSKEPGFMKSLDSAAIAFVNMNAVVKKAPASQHGIKSAELIARYCDGMMRKNSKMSDEMEMDETQKKVIIIFKFLNDKDVFLKFYTRHFCKRLINDLSASDEAESSFIQKLKDTCGHEFTSRLSKMVTDCAVSKDLTSNYKEKQMDTEKRLEFSVQILSTGTWPSFPQTCLTLPKQLSETIDGFVSFYNDKYNGRRLQWVLGQSRGEVTCSAFKGKKYVFGVTTSQMCTLLMFNEQSTYTAEQLMSGTGMDAKGTSAVLGSLIKNQILQSDTVSSNDSEDVPMNAKITLNSSYSNKKVRVDLSKMTVAVQVAKDSEQVQKGVEEDRKNMISACIVRIMKARKTISHQLLMGEILTQLHSRFKPKVEIIKRIIETLIEKEYMKRNASQRDHYDYMA